jgi:PAS domain S-box-containing protein
MQNIVYPGIAWEYSIDASGGYCQSIIWKCTMLVDSPDKLLNEGWSMVNITETLEFKLKNFIECSHLGTWEWNVQTGETVFNDLWAQIVGYTLDELAPVSIKTWMTLAHPDDLKKSEYALNQHFSGKLPLYNIECRMKHKDGHWVWVNDRGKVVSWTADGKPLMMFGTHADITDRKNAEENQKNQSTYLETIIENQPGLVWLKDVNGRFLAVNKAFALSCGYDSPSSIVGLTDPDIWPEAMADKYCNDDEDVIASCKSKIVEELIIDKGEQRWFETFKSPIKDDKGNVIGTTGYARDITERKLMEENLQKSQKLESLGMLAGGIAHDFNNLLGGIFGCIDLAVAESNDKIVVDYLSMALATMDRARSLTGQLLTFANGGAPIKKLKRLIPFLEETARFALSGSNVSCNCLISNDLWQCEFDNNQLSQVIDNIVINGQQAMPEGGTIVIEADNMQLEEKAHPVLPKGKYVRIRIKDAGIGMTKEVMRKIFDPFFSTKTKGHGLGLATSYSIIKRHNGYIDVESEPGIGSVFTIYLPASTESIVSITKTVTNHQGAGSILVMDDEAIIRDTISAMLIGMGYEVYMASNSKDAIDKFNRALAEDRSFSLLILDLTIHGGPGGKETIHEIRKIDKEIPAFVASGYADDPVMANPSHYGFTTSISKPFMKEDLAALLERYVGKGN